MKLLPAAVAPTVSFALKAGYGLTSSHSPVFLIPFNHPMHYFQLLQPIWPISPFTSSPHPHLPSCHSNELTSLAGRAEKLGESLLWGQHDFFLTLLHGTIAIKNGLPFNSHSFTEGKRWKFSRWKSKYFIYQLWVPYSDSSCLSLHQPKYFGDYTTVCPPSLFWSSSETSYTLYIKIIPQRWEMKWELCLHELHWRSHNYIDTGVICNSQHMYFITGKCWHTHLQTGNWISVCWSWVHFIRLQWF